VVFVFYHFVVIAILYLYFSMLKLLITEDDITFAQILERYLSRHGYQIVLTHNLEQAKKEIAANDDLYAILLDYRLPDGHGIDLLEYMITKNLKVPVLMMTSFNDVKVAVQCIKKGAREYITKPINQEELLMLLENIQAKPSPPTDTKSPEIKESGATVQFVKGHSDAAEALYQHVSLVAQTDMSVLINGESGTGKEHIARALHDKSKRANKPFIAVDCGALSAELAASELFGHVKGAFTGALMDKVGIFEAANGGTIFLDEVGNLSYEVQVKLLRAIQQREIVPVGSNKVIKVDVRLITATNEDFKTAIQNASFREDLYHRINEFKIKIPALRERREDLDEFVNFFIKLSNEELCKNVHGIDADVRKIFKQYHWPGNIRELKNIIKRAVLLAQSDMITKSELPEDMELSIMEYELEPTADLKAVQQQTEKELILKTLAETKYNKSKAAKLLNIDRTTLYNKLAKYGIDDV
jgi:two-component system response regulator HydG